MRRPVALLPVLMLLLLVVAGVVLWRPATDVNAPEAAPSENRAVLVSSTTPNAPEVTGASAGGGAVAATPLTTDPDPARFRRAYLLGLDGDDLSLVSMQDIEGDFAKRRSTGEAWAGMLRCRLYAADNRLLAEELVPAPDLLCRVLDSKDGHPKVAQFTAEGPVRFQLRMPRFEKAVRLEVVRVTDSGSLGRDQKVGSISLQ